MFVGKGLIEARQRYWLAQKALAKLWTYLRVTSMIAITWKQKVRPRMMLAVLVKDCEIADDEVRTAFVNYAALAFVIGHRMRRIVVHHVHATTLYEFTML